MVSLRMRPQAWHASVIECAVPVLAIVSAGTEAESGKWKRYVLIQCYLSPEVTGSPWVLQMEGGSDSIVPTSRLQCRVTTWADSSLPVKVGPLSKGSGISLLLMIEDLASSLPQNLFFSSLKDDLIVTCPLKADFDQCCVQSGSWMYAEKLLCLPLSAAFWP